MTNNQKIVFNQLRKLKAKSTLPIVQGLSLLQAMKGKDIKKVYVNLRSSLAARVRPFLELYCQPCATIQLWYVCVCITDRSDFSAYRNQSVVPYAQTTTQTQWHLPSNPFPATGTGLSATFPSIPIVFVCVIGGKCALPGRPKLHRSGTTTLKGVRSRLACRVGRPVRCERLENTLNLSHTPHVTSRHNLRVRCVWRAHEMKR